MQKTDGDRLKSSLLELAQIGATPAGGVSRLALTDEDRQGRELFANWATAAGLVVRVDDMGTQYARLEGTDSSAEPILIGSHLDSVPAGGKFDGALGVMVALEVVRTLQDSGTRLRRPVEVVNFTNEEGVRFEPAIVASGVLAGRFSPEYVYDRTDRQGLTFGEELQRIGYRGSIANRPRAIRAYLEFHIEQGPVLEAESLPLAVVEGILGVQWMNITFTGQAQHAGPSPMRSRRDAMVAAGRAIAALRDLALEYPDPVATTVGRLQPIPGVINQIPGQVVMSLDFRHTTPEGLDELAGKVRELLQRIASEEKVEVQVDDIWRIDPTLFDPAIVNLIEEGLKTLGVPYRRMISGAGHDAKYMDEIAPTGMLFVRTLGGKSHCETEAIEWEDARMAADVMLYAVRRVAES